MPDSKITALTSISTSTDPANDPLVIVDVSDTSMAASGTTKKVTLNQLLGASGTATLASATITGDLTVDTNTLYVNSTSNNVGLGTLTPSGASGRALEIYGGAGQSRIALKNDTTGSASTDGSQIALVGSQLVIQNREASEITFETNNSERYRLASDGVATWSNVGGVAGTAMALNSTGLGVGVGPSYPFHLRNSAAAIGMIHSTNANGPYVIFQNSTANFGDIGSELSITGGGSAGNFTLNSRFTSNLCFAVSDSVKMRIDSSGNVGIGVTPSAWGSDTKAIQMAGSAFSAVAASARLLNLTNCYWDGTNFRFTGNGTAQQFRISAGTSQFEWHLGASGTTGNIVSFTQAMTLDASGNLLVGTTSNPNSSRAAVKTASVTSALSLNSVTGDTAQELFVINKFDSDSTTSQVFARFTNNNGAAGSGQINGNGANACAFGSFSDARLKENIVSLPSQLANILSLRPVEFDYKDGSGHQIGFVAQEIQEVYADTVAEQNGFLTVTGWSKTEARLVSAIKELAAKVQALEAKLA